MDVRLREVAARALLARSCAMRKSGGVEARRFPLTIARRPPATLDDENYKGTGPRLQTFLEDDR